MTVWASEWAFARILPSHQTLPPDSRAKTETKDSWGVMPSSISDSKDLVTAPIGSGIALLAGMGIAYCVIKKKSQTSMS